MASTRIGVIDDHPLFREGVVRSLSENKNFIVVGEGASGEDACRIARDLTPDILLLDVSMPGNGLSAIANVRHISPSTKVIMLTASEEVESLVAALRQGALGYVLKGVGARGLIDAIATVLRGSRCVSPSMSAKIMERTLHHDRSAETLLTPREIEIVDLVSLGLSNKRIGLKLDLQEKTVKHHMTQILTKLGVTNRTEAAMRWRDRLA
ncbi:response regulator [Rhizobium grahamii]|uniref:DNA-binding response regulator n=1 Tax=Rhizobium grahamii TaxID=1120045 RepID=A0A370KGH1_9HYPH|nr:response regulator transcription factor [Rhizobium grahamii]RDJ03841.1 DNA-binding response regulator [Rhizobium grahamii]